MFTHATWSANVRSANFSAPRKIRYTAGNRPTFVHEITDLTLTDQVTGVEIDGPDIGEF